MRRQANDWLSFEDMVDDQSSIASSDWDDLRISPDFSFLDDDLFVCKTVRNFPIKNNIDIPYEIPFINTIFLTYSHCSIYRLVQHYTIQQMETNNTYAPRLIF